MARSAGREILAFILLVVVSAGVSFIAQRYVRRIPLPSGQGDIMKVSLDAEEAFARNVKKFVAHDGALVSNEIVTSAMDSIVQRITVAIDSLPYALDVVVVDGPVVNAVTFPGGLIIVYVPLIRMCDNPGQLAAVVAHEAAHVVNRDPARRMIRQFGINAVLSMMGGSGNYLQNAIENLVDCSYTREQESQADSLALVLLAKARISPSHFAGFMTRLENESAAASQEFLRYFNTHPEIAGRIQKANAAALALPDKELEFAIDWQEVRKSLPSLFRK